MSAYFFNVTGILRSIQLLKLLYYTQTSSAATVSLKILLAGIGPKA